MENTVKIILFSAASILFLFIISKIAGKKQISQLNFIDFVFAISVGSIAAEMATDLDEVPYYFYLLAMTVFLIIEIIMSYLERKGRLFKAIFKSQPTVIINNGEFSYANLKKSKLDINEFIMLSRNLGYFDISTIAFAIFETNGNLSILPKGSQKPVVTSDLNINTPQSALQKYFVTEGKISYTALEEANKTEEWLYGKLNLRCKSEIKKILLVAFDSINDDVIVIKKE